jgi:diaminopimelate epimerase
MSIPFVKYSGCLNDFVLIDNRQLNIQLDTQTIISLCDRRRGIGADGVILIENSKSSTCNMRIFNADGGEAEMCGNGIRSVADYIRHQGHPENTCTIESMQRHHKASWTADRYTIDMGPPTEVNMNTSLSVCNQTFNFSTLNTGVPHAVIFCDNIDQFNLHEIAPHIRYHEKFTPGGTNVNIASIHDQEIRVRTYERGVEAETPACGTGATAAALAATKYGLQSPITVHLQSGDQLIIHFTMLANQIKTVTMTGTCRRTFEGTITI